MAKSVVNAEFAATSNAHYAKAGLLPRAKGQRKGPLLEDHLPFGRAFEGMLPHGWQMRVLGTGPGYSDNGQVIQYDHLAVTSPKGWVFPAYRRHCPHGGSFAICHSLQHLGRPVRKRA